MSKRKCCGGPTISGDQYRADETVLDDLTLIKGTAGVNATAGGLKFYASTADSTLHVVNEAGVDSIVGGGGAGDCFSTATSGIANKIARYDGTGNKTVKDSLVFIDDAGNLTSNALNSDTTLGVVGDTTLGGPVGMPKITTPTNAGLGSLKLYASSVLGGLSVIDELGTNRPISLSAATTGVANRLSRYTGGDNKTVTDSGVVLDDANNISGVYNITVSNNINVSGSVKMTGGGDTSIILPTAATSPTTGLAAGMLYYDTLSKLLRFYDGTQWKELTGFKSLITRFPPAALTETLTTWVPTASSWIVAPDLRPHKAFDYLHLEVDAATYGFTSGSGTYVNTTGYPVAPPETTPISAVSIEGEWLQLECPAGTTYELTEYKISSRSGTAFASSPEIFTVAGSNDASTWTLIDSRSGLTWTASETKTFSVGVQPQYRYFRIVLEKCKTINNGNCGMTEWTLLGRKN